MSHHHEENKRMHPGFKVAKFALKVAAVAAAFCLVNEVHKVHKAIDAKK